MNTELEQLQLLRSEDLSSLARNPVANLRDATIRLLIERGSQEMGANAPFSSVSVGASDYSYTHRRL